MPERVSADEARLDQLLDVVCSTLKADVSTERLEYLRAEMRAQVTIRNRIEGFLDALLGSLGDALPAEKIADLRREIRSHLDARISAYAELGSSREEAVCEAIEQFGDSRSALAAWATAWMEADPLLRTRAVRCATSIGLRWVGASFLIEALLHVATGLSFSPLGIHGWPGFVTLVVLLPMIMGVGIGLHAPDRPLRATLSGLGLAYVPFVFVYWGTSRYADLTSVGLATLQVGIWAAVGGATAGATGLLRRMATRTRKTRALE